MSGQARSAEPLSRRRRLLILSFSPIAQDARVLKQVALFGGRTELTTCGFGPAPAGVDHHVTITHRTLPGRTWDALLQARAYTAGYWMLPDVRAARRALAGRVFDAVLADDIDTLPLALSLRPLGGVHADLHEYFPRLHEEHPPWKRRIGPWYAWLCRRHLPRAASVTTVGEAIAAEYSRQFGVRVGVVTNATPFADLSPTPVHDPVRVVHSGTSHRERNIGAVVDGVLAVPGHTLDLFLTPNDPGNLAELRRRAEGEPRLRVHDPVPYAQLVETLNGFDLGVHLLPPLNFNFANALPNKVFDFAQARLGAVVGPSPAMADLVRANGFGEVCAGYTGEDLADVLRGLTPARIRAMKGAADAHARDLSAETQVLGWERALRPLLDSGGRAARVRGR